MKRSYLGEFLMKYEKSFFQFKLQPKKNLKPLQNLNHGDILKIKNKDSFYEFDYVIEDDRGAFIQFRCPYGIGAVIIRKKCLVNFFESKNNSFIIYEKVKNTA